MIDKIKKLIIKYEEIIRYVIVGGLTTLISLFSYYFVTFTFLDPKVSIQLQIANIISWVSAVFFAYFMNRKHVFKSKEKPSLSEASKFCFSRLSTLVIDMSIMFIFVTCLHFSDKIMKLIVQFVVMVLNYLFSKLLVFKKR